MMMKPELKTIDFRNDSLIFIDQTKLPLHEVYIQTSDVERIAEGIEKLEIRGAPAIGVAAAYAIALSFNSGEPDNISEIFNNAYNRLASTRPTAVNLFWALDEMKKEFNLISATPEINAHEIYKCLLLRAQLIHNDDIKKCRSISENGLKAIAQPLRVLTHCNAGSMATGGEGTALGVIKEAFNKGYIKHVYVDETRPLFQGSRLTAFELNKAGIPFSINTDSTAAFLMKQGLVDMVITGADRIAANGDSANKIGTYNLAVLCSFHKIPFYIAAPTSTIDTACMNGDQIKIELRDKSEVTKSNGTSVTCDDFEVYSPAFDVTPAELITGIITDKDLYNYPYRF